MVSSYLNLVTFLLTTLFYYLALKPTLNISQLINQEEYEAYIKNNNIYLVIYFLLVLVVQFIVNASVITNKCGGSISQNIGASGYITFISWILIFGVVIIILNVYPGFKSAFSDVVGYYYVSGSANNLLTELLIDKNIQKKINNSVGTEEEKKNMQVAADAIIKICGNTSILINQIVPSNFLEYWNILKPLMKEKYQVDTPETMGKMNELLQIVTTRDNVGEIMWYVYTGILLVSIVQLKISTRPCESDLLTMEKNYNNYLDKKKDVDSKIKKDTSSTYILKN